MIGLGPCIMLSAFVFACGLYCLAVKRNAVGVLMGIELVLNAANINFVAAARFVPGFQLEGQVFAVMVIVLAAAETAIALAIILNFYNNRQSVDLNDAKELKG